MPAARLPMILACASVCGAQPAAPPKILLVVRQQFKSGKAHARERLERATAAIYNRLDVPVYWMEMQAFTGAPEALLFGPYDSFAGVEKAGAVLGPLYQAHPELARMQAGIDDTLSSQTTILAVRRDSPGGTRTRSIWRKRASCECWWFAPSRTKRRRRSATHPDRRLFTT